MSIPLEHEELTGRIRQLAFEIHRYFGDGFLEKVYENALCHRLRKAGMKVQQQVPILVRDDDGTVVGEYFSDILVEEFLILEIKAVKTLSSQHQAQVIHYLRATGHTLGLLINFGSEKLEFKRLIETRSRSKEISMQDKISVFLCSVFGVFGGFGG